MGSRHNNLATRTTSDNGGQHGYKRWREYGVGGPSLLTDADWDSESDEE